jgi:ubiquinone/menaquinone biosynthesis C-methylase UbiE
MDIADIGGATGAYAFWLAGMGHRVHLLDLAQGHIDTAQKKSLELNIPLASLSNADARALPYESGCMDMALLMGALYHFRERESRLKCLTEAFRVLKNGGVLLCTVINRYNFIIAPLKYKHLMENVGPGPIEQALATGIMDNANYSILPLSYCHTPGEIVFDLGEAGFGIVGLIAVEGIANAMGDNRLPEDELEAAQLLKCIEMTESVPELIGVTRNIIAVGIKK